jgi:hypothetical protein
MKTITLVDAGSPPETLAFPRWATRVADPLVIPAGGADNQPRDWDDPAMIAALDLFQVCPEANGFSEIDRDWASLAKAALTRWLRENPF